MKKVVLSLSILVLIVSSIFIFNKGDDATAQTTLSAYQGNQYETGAYQSLADNPFNAYNWNSNYPFVSTDNVKNSFRKDLDSYDTQREYHFSSTEAADGNILISKDGLLIYKTPTNSLLARKKTGEIAWNKPNMSMFDPVIGSNGNVYTVINNSITATNAQTGMEVWKKSFENIKFLSPVTIDGNKMLYLVARDTVIKDNQNSVSIYVLDVNGNLKSKWEVAKIAAATENIKDGTVNIILSSQGNLIFRISEKLYNFSKTSELQWSMTINNGYWFYTLDNQGNILLTSYGKIKKISQQTGEVVTEENYPYSELLDLPYSRYNYDPKEGYPFPSSDPIVVDAKSGNIYVASGGNLTCFDSELQQKWSINPDKDFRGFRQYTFNRILKPIIDRTGDIIFSQVFFEKEDYHYLWALDVEGIYEYQPSIYKISPDGALIWMKNMDGYGQKGNFEQSGLVMDSDGIIYYTDKTYDKDVWWAYNGVWTYTFNSFGTKNNSQPTCKGYWEMIEEDLKEQIISPIQVDDTIGQLQDMLDKYIDRDLNDPNLTIEEINAVQERLQAMLDKYNEKENTLRAQ